jgi:hypothetical protein
MLLFFQVITAGDCLMCVDNDAAGAYFVGTTRTRWPTAGTTRGRTMKNSELSILSTACCLLMMTLIIASCEDHPPPGPQDEQGPEAIRYISTARATDNSMLVYWEAPHDVEPNKHPWEGGPATAYDLRYSTSTDLGEITEWCVGSGWINATEAVSEPRPGEPFTADTCLVGGLEPGLTYYFACRAVDHKGNWSGIDNVAIGTTTGQRNGGTWSLVQGNRRYMTNFVLVGDDGSLFIGGLRSFSDSSAADIFVSKHTTTGSPLWEEYIAGAGYYFGEAAVLADDGNIVVAGYHGTGDSTTDEAVVTKFGGGSFYWCKEFGGDSCDRVHAIRKISGGRYVVVGESCSFGDGSKDIYLAWLDDQGTLLWDTTYGGAGNDAGWAVAVTGDGGYAIGGLDNDSCYLMIVDSLGTLQWSRKFDTQCPVKWIENTPDGGLILGGRSVGWLFNCSSFRPTRTDALGNILWEADSRISPCYPIGFVVNDLVVAGDGGYVGTGRAIARHHPGSDDLLLVKYDASGTVVWFHTYGYDGRDEGRGLVETGDGGFVAVGPHRVTSGSFYEKLIIRVDSTGKI